MGYKIRVSSRAIIIHNGYILLNCFGNGLYYNFPGGGIEKNETALEAVVREVYEESGLTVEVEKHLFTFEYEPSHCDNFEGNGHHISTFFNCRVFGSCVLTEPIEPHTNPHDGTIKSHAEWVSVAALYQIPIVPKTILKPLMEYIETGTFQPSFFEQYNN